MNPVKEKWRIIIEKVLMKAAEERGVNLIIGEEGVLVETPPKQDLGDLAFPMFPYAKYFKTKPTVIAEELTKRIVEEYGHEGRAETAGPYVNIFLARENIIENVLKEIFSAENEYGETELLKGKRITVEFSCPNTNKPLHLGHLRNDAIGESVSRILKAAGGEVWKVNLINDRGVHICKSMLAYQQFGNAQSPEEAGIKSDHFVGKFYVRYAKWEKEDPQVENNVRKMLKKWEAGDPEILNLWKKMNRWAISGIEATYRKTGITFDKTYYESATYSRGKEEVLKGLERGIFYKNEDGAICVDLNEINLDTKVLLRADGTSLYLTQDIGTSIARHEDWPFDQFIYVVASEQKYHFTVLFYVLKKLGFQWADHLFHLAYGMVHLPEGKMKSREGTVVDADDLLEELSKMAAQEIETKERTEDVGDVAVTSRSIALAALHYYLLQVSPYKDTVFNPEESISFNGNTGPYLQYMGARISNLLKKWEERKETYSEGEFNPRLIASDEEWQIIKLLSSYPERVSQAAEERNPAVIASYLYDLGRDFSRWYHEHPILHNEDVNLVVSRITLAKAALGVLRHAFHLLNLPFLSNM